MTHVATLGVSSCATIAIAGFKDGQREQNELYKKDPASYKEVEGMSVSRFYSDVLYPVSQPLGKTKDMPFEKLMQDVEKSGLKTKFVLAVLNQDQYFGRDKYWHKELKRWGFKLISKTGNSIGSTNYIYSRAPLAMEIAEDEV